MYVENTILMYLDSIIMNHMPHFMMKKITIFEDLSMLTSITAPSVEWLLHYQCPQNFASESLNNNKILS